jgi:hypothetical protein
LTGLCAVVAALVLAGCGGSVGLAPTSAPPSRSELASVRATLTQFAAAMAAGNGAQACALLDSGVQQQLAGLSAAAADAGNPTSLQLCEQTIASVSARLTSRERAILDSIHVGEISVDQNSATVDPQQIASPDGNASLGGSGDAGASEIELTFEGGRWQIDSLG